MMKRRKESLDSAPDLKPLLQVANSFNLQFSPDARLLAASAGGKVWSIEDGSQAFQCKVTSEVTELLFSPDGKSLAGLTTGGMVTIHDGKSGAVVRKFKTGGGGFLSFDPTGQFLAVANHETGLSLWEIATGNQINQASLDGKVPDGLGWYPGSQLWVCISGYDESLEQDAASVLLFDATLQRRKQIDLRQQVERVVLHPKAKVCVIAACGDEIWVHRGTKPVQRAKLDSERVKALAISRDGKWIAAIVDRGKPDAFLLIEAEELAVCAEREIAYGERATFSGDSTLVAIGTWKKGEVWAIAALVGAP